MKRYLDSALGLVIVALCTVLAIVTVFDGNKTPKKPLFVTAKTDAKTMRAAMGGHFAMKKVSENVVWETGGTTVPEELIFQQFGLNTEAQRQAFRKTMAKQGGKRLTEVCYNMYSVDKTWSAGYCYTVQIQPTEEVA